ncbi:MAG: hypothetical protein CME69_01845 [Halobacteriovorax sp.]|nr:hypothetical protein [Halobacteriovorax sp.]
MTGNKTIDNVIVLLVFLATAGALGTFVYTQMIYKKPLPTNEQGLAELKEDTANITVPESYKLDKIIVNLPSRTRRLRFLDVQIHLVVFKQETISILENQKAIINDIVIDVASNMEPEELNSVSGKLIFESRVKNKINETLNMPAVKELFYTKFVVQ